MPPEFIEDYHWALDHMGELGQKHGNTWVAIVGKKVVAIGEKVREIDLVNGRPTVTVFVEREPMIL